MASEGITIKATRGEYKGSPVLTLTSGTNERYPFTFGLQKAGRILGSIEAIRKFVAEEGPKEEARRAAAKKKAAEAK